MQFLPPRHESVSVLSPVPALSSDSDKDGEDEGNDEDELHGLQSFQIQSNCNTERDLGMYGKGDAWTGTGEKWARVCIEYS